MARKTNIMKLQTITLLILSCAAANARRLDDDECSGQAVNRTIYNGSKNRFLVSIINHATGEKTAHPVLASSKKELTFENSCIDVELYGFGDDGEDTTFVSSNSLNTDSAFVDAVGNTVTNEYGDIAWNSPTEGSITIDSVEAACASNTAVNQTFYNDGTKAITFYVTDLATNQEDTYRVPAGSTQEYAIQSNCIDYSVESGVNAYASATAEPPLIDATENVTTSYGTLEWNFPEPGDITFHHLCELGGQPTTRTLYNNFTKSVYLHVNDVTSPAGVTEIIKVSKGASVDFTIPNNCATIELWDSKQEEQLAAYNAKSDPASIESETDSTHKVVNNGEGGSYSLTINWNSPEQGDISVTTIPWEICEAEPANRTIHNELPYEIQLYVEDFHSGDSVRYEVSAGTSIEFTIPHNCIYLEVVGENHAYSVATSEPTYIASLTDTVEEGYGITVWNTPRDGDITFQHLCAEGGQPSTQTIYNHATTNHKLIVLDDSSGEEASVAVEAGGSMEFTLPSNCASVQVWDVQTNVELAAFNATSEPAKLQSELDTTEMIVDTRYVTIQWNTPAAGDVSIVPIRYFRGRSPQKATSP